MLDLGIKSKTNISQLLKTTIFTAVCRVKLAATISFTLKSLMGAQKEMSAKLVVSNKRHLESKKLYKICYL